MLENWPWNFPPEGQQHEIHSIAVSLKRIADALEAQAAIAGTAAAYAPATHDLRGESMENA